MITAIGSSKTLETLLNPIFPKHRMFRISTKRAQVTVFLIIAIVIIVLAIMLWFSKSSPIQTTLPDTDTSGVRAFVSACVSESAREGTDLFGLTGGLPIPALFQPSALVYDRRVAYYRIADQLLDLDKSKYEGFLDEWVSVGIGACIQDLPFDVITKPDLPLVKSSIQDNGIIFTAQVPVSIKSGQSVVAVSPGYSALLPIKVLPFIQEAKDWAKEEKEHDGAFDLFRLADLKKKGWIPSVATFDNQTLVILIEDPSQKIGDHSFAFQFATSNGVSQS